MRGDGGSVIIKWYRPIVGYTIAVILGLALSACGNAAPFFAGMNAGVNNAPPWQPLYVQAPSQPTSIHCIQVRQGYQSCSAQ